MHKTWECLGTCLFQWWLPARDLGAASNNTEVGRPFKHCQQVWTTTTTTTTTWETHGLISTWTIYLTPSMGLGTWFHKNKRHQNDKVGNQSVSLGAFLEFVSKQYQKMTASSPDTDMHNLSHTSSSDNVFEWNMRNLFQHQNCFINLKKRRGQSISQSRCWNLIENSHKRLWIVSERHGRCTVWIRNRFTESVCKRLDGCIKYKTAVHHL